MATDLTLILMAIHRQDAGRPAKVGTDEQPGRGGRLARNPEQAGIDVGGAGRDHPQGGLGPGQDMTGMMHDPVASHRGHDLETVGNGLGGEGPGVLGRLRPGSLDLEAASQDPDDGAMPSTGELGRGRIGDQQQSLHFVSGY